ncbi:Ger(x)C family spore germination protein [Mesobacillus harenae]|uniref:Ger(x)C family spore germination protein n=1 Tax=Mesobacillus harenae TaxID=2213203 RepID=UPI00157FD1CB|nr:Ger(x)C family spore germination protein [Mesobacillus harenae]
MVRKLLLVIICGNILFLGGCWDKTELTELAFVMAIGVDKAEDDDKFEFTYQVVIPNNIPLGQSGIGGEGVPIVTFTAISESLIEGTRQVSETFSRELYYAHTAVAVFGEEVAKSRMNEVLDLMEREPEFRTTTAVLIAKNVKAKDIVSILTPLEKIPAEKISKAIKVSEGRWGESFEVDIDEVVRALVSEGREPAISGITIEGDASSGGKKEDLEKVELPVYLKVNGLAIFKDGKFNSWIEGKKARGVSWVLDKVKSTVVNTEWEGKEKAVNLKVIRSNTKITSNLNNGVPSFHVSISMEGTISEVKAAVDLSDPIVLMEIEKALESEIKQETLDAIQTAQAVPSDVFGFGEQIHKSYPKKWKELKGSWEEEFSKAKVTVSVDVFIRRTGSRTKSFL